MTYFIAELSINFDLSRGKFRLVYISIKIILFILLPYYREFFFFYRDWVC